MNLTVSEFTIIIISFFIKNVLHRYFKIDSLLSLSYSSTDSWNYVLESNALLRYNIPLYEGDYIHQPPLLVYLWSSVANMTDIVQFFIFNIIDAICIWMALKLTNEIFMHYSKNQEKSEIAEPNMLISIDSLRDVRLYVCLWYAFNPFLMVSTLSQSTTNVYNLVLLLLFNQIVKGNYKFGAVLCAWLTYSSLYPVVLIFGLFTSVKWNYKRCLKTTLVFLLSLGSLLILSYYLVGVKFIQNVYLHHFYLDDSTPQMNVYWYMMATMFDHFRLFFKCTFQLVLFSLCGGLAMKYKDDRVFLTYALCWAITVLKPYPAIGELGQLLALLPIYKHIFPYLRGVIVTVVMFLCVIVLGPLMFYLWMTCGTANANFYFAITLVYCSAQSHLSSSILSGYAKYHFHLRHGKSIKNIDGSEAQLKAK